MKIVVLNGSPKGKYSITLQYVNFLEKQFDQHEFKMLNISQMIRKIEKDSAYFDEIIRTIDESDLVIWSFGLWVLAVPAQYMRFIELISERGAGYAFREKYCAAISTSIQFYDHTAHNYIRGVCEDLEMRFLESMSFYILDFMKEEKRQDLSVFFENLILSIEKNVSATRQFIPLRFHRFSYQSGEPSEKIDTDKKVLVITDRFDRKTNLV